jgi:hypothetical protein
MELEDFNKIREYMRLCWDTLEFEDKENWSYYMSLNEYLVKNQIRITQIIKDQLGIDFGSEKWKEPEDRFGLSRIKRSQSKVI